ncbi:MAG: O-methyltransferase [Clostridia bacterium]
MRYEHLKNFENINDFTRGVLPKREGKLGELEEQCREMGLPIIKPETVAFLKTVLSSLKPKRILEIGTCVGFSSLFMLSICKDAKIVTIDRYKYMIDRAKVNFKEFDAEKSITLIEGQATDILENMKGEFDFVFLDAAKAQYPFFYPNCMRLLAKNGVFIADNVLASGIVADPTRASRRDMTTVKRLSEFIKMSLNDPLTASSLLPFADGIIYSVKL